MMAAPRGKCGICGDENAKLAECDDGRKKCLACVSVWQGADVRAEDRGAIRQAMRAAGIPMRRDRWASGEEGRKALRRLL